MIKILPENLVNQIAAGEVIERPASIVKELIENSLDAGADNIIIDIKNGGKSFIKINDNGKGMSRNDLELSIQRHATSKISKESDLWEIATMGFRGEALASISSVSKLTIKSKTKDDLAGTQLDSSGGEIISIQDIGMNNGTSIEVFDLFFNTPARQRYLKKDNIEFGYISSTVNTIALANPEISIKLIHNGKTVYDFAKSTDLSTRITDVFGKNTADLMLPVFYGGSELKINGFIGKPEISRATTQHQYIFVNGRPVTHHLLANRIKAAYATMLMEHKKPIFILNITIDPSLIDVNVHPRKIEIRFEDQQSIIKIIYGTIKTALEKVNLMPNSFINGASFSSRKNLYSDFKNTPNSKNISSSPGAQFKNTYSNHKNAENIQDALSFSKEILKDRESKSLNEINTESSLKVISQISNSYIIAENQDGLVLIDQHAAHEKVRFEQLMDQFENQKKSIQPLLMPFYLELTLDENALINENLEVFEKLGFKIEKNEKFVVSAVPSFLANEDIDEIVKGVLDDIKEEKTPSKLQGKAEMIITYMSCRSAIKFGRNLSILEMQSLITQMENLKRPYHCPHGRPTMISLSLSDLEKMFKRK